MNEQKRINLAPEILVKDIERMKKDTENPVDNKFPFLLIGRRHLRDNNSWLHNFELLMKGKNRCTVLMNDEDAKNLEFENSQMLKVSSRVGAIEIPLEVSDKMMSGVVSIPHGYGHGREGVKLDTAKSYAGISINDLTDEQMIDELTGNAAFSNVKVKLERV